MLRPAWVTLIRAAEEVLISYACLPCSLSLQHPDAVTPLVAAAHGGHARVVSVLLAAGAQPDLPKSHNVTALQMAAVQGHCEVVQQLLAVGSNPDLQQNDVRG